MKLSDLAKGSTVLLGVVVAGYVSTTYIDQRFTAPLKTANAPAPTGSHFPSACVDADGSWKNWPWPNVPTLSLDVLDANAPARRLYARHGFVAVGPPLEIFAGRPGRVMVRTL